jgi:hypothetical protein
VVDSVGEDANRARSDRLVEVAAEASSDSQTVSLQAPRSTSSPSTTVVLELCLTDIYAVTKGHSCYSMPKHMRSYIPLHTEISGAV